MNEKCVGTYFYRSNIENARTRQFSAVYGSLHESRITSTNSSNFRDSLPFGNSITVGVLELVIYYELPTAAYYDSRLLEEPGFPPPHGFNFEFFYIMPEPISLLSELSSFDLSLPELPCQSLPLPFILKVPFLPPS